MCYSTKEASTTTTIIKQTNITDNSNFANFSSRFWSNRHKHTRHTQTCMHHAIYTAYHNSWAKWNACTPWNSHAHVSQALRHPFAHPPQIDSYRAIKQNNLKSRCPIIYPHCFAYTPTSESTHTHTDTQSNTHTHTHPLLAHIHPQLVDNMRPRTNRYTSNFCTNGIGKAENSCVGERLLALYVMCVFCSARCLPACQPASVSLPLAATELKFVAWDQSDFGQLPVERWCCFDVSGHFCF